MKDLTVKQTKSTKFSLFCIKPSDYVNASVLAAGVAEVITIPTDAQTVLFSSTGNFYANSNAAASVPAADITDGTSSILNPSGWVVEAADTIGIIASDDCVVTLEFFK